MIAAEVFVPGPIPADVKKEPSDFPDLAGFYTWLFSDIPDYPRCDRWVRRVVARLVEKEVLDPAAIAALDGIPRLSHPVEVFLSR